MPASAPAPIGTSEPLVLNDVCTRTNEPIFKHVSVPGTYQKPAPYRLQTLTYSTGLAFTGRSAACAPATATRPAAEPRRRLLTILIDDPPFAFPGGIDLHAPSGRDHKLQIKEADARIKFV